MKKLKDRRVTFFVTEEIEKKILEIKERTGSAVSEIARRAMIAYLESKKNTL